MALGSAYTNTTGSATTILANGSLEGPAMFKNGRTYFWVASSEEYLNQLGMKQVVYAASTAGSPMGTYGSTNTVYLNNDAYGTGFDIQSRQVFQSVRNPSRFFLDR